MRRYLRYAQIGSSDGGTSAPPILPINPISLTWEGIYDGRLITGVLDGASLTQWNDTSGNGRHLTNSFAIPPVYRAAGSSNGLPVVDFSTRPTTGARLDATYPAGGLPTANGLSMICYHTLDVIAAKGTAQITAADTVAATRWFQYMQADNGIGDPFVPRPMQFVEGQSPNPLGPEATVNYLTTGGHVITSVLRPPFVTGNTELWYDGMLIGQGIGWTTALKTRLSVVDGLNGLGGKRGFVGVTSFAFTPVQIVGLSRYLKGVFG